MNQPKGYDAAKVQGSYTPISTGGHILKIMQVEEMVSSKGKPMVKVSFDTAEDDREPSFFSKEYKADTRPDKKWPRGGVQYVITEDGDGNCAPQFKTFCVCVEKSNPGFSIPWGQDIGPAFKNKRIGGIFGEVENFYNGKSSMRHELRWFRTVDGAIGAPAPDPKYLTDSQRESMGAIQAAEADGFQSVPEIEEELPFI